MTQPICLACRREATRKASRFCSEICAADWAERYANEIGDEWCPHCNDWLASPHPH